MAERSKGSRAEVIRWGEKLFERHLVSGWGGNVSCRFGRSRYLITGQHAALGFLGTRDVVEVDARGKAVNPKQRPSSETALHLAVYAATDARAVVHVHPPEIIAYCRGRDEFVPLSFEEEYSLGRVPVISHDGPTVTDPAPVAEQVAPSPGGDPAGPRHRGPGPRPAGGVPDHRPAGGSRTLPARHAVTNRNLRPESRSEPRRCVTQEERP